MEFINMTNIFSVFGNFVVFDEDTLAIVNKVYDGCNISINQEPNNQANKSGKVLKIVDQNKYTLTLRPNRLDVQTPGFNKEHKNAELDKVKEIFNTFAEMFEGSYGTRIAYVSNDFVFDDNGDVMKALNDRIHLFSNSNVSELHLRLNAPMEVIDEPMNIVTNIDNVLISANNNANQRRRSIIVASDINTLINNEDDRFDLKNLDNYFSAMFDVAKDKLEDLKLIA